MSNKYLEKIAANYITRGLFSPTWQEASIAKEHGKHTDKNTFGQVVANDLGQSARASIRGGFTGIAGAAGGALTGLGAVALAHKLKLKNTGSIRKALSKEKVSRYDWDTITRAEKVRGNIRDHKRFAAAGGAIVGGVGGVGHGIYKSLKNQAEEHHKKYGGK